MSVSSQFQGARFDVFRFVDLNHRLRTSGNMSVHRDDDSRGAEPRQFHYIPMSAGGIDPDSTPREPEETDCRNRCLEQSPVTRRWYSTAPYPGEIEESREPVLAPGTYVP